MGVQVEIGGERIEAVVTDSPAVLSEWLNSVLLNNTAVVGVSGVRFTGDSSSDEASPLDALSLSVGTHSLVFLLHDPRPSDSKFAGCHLSAFFGAPGLVAVAPDARRLSLALRRLHGVVALGLVDAPLEEAVGGHVAASAREIRANRSYWKNNKGFPFSNLVLSHEMIRFAVLDSFLCFLIASRHISSSKKEEQPGVDTTQEKEKEKGVSNIVDEDDLVNEYDGDWIIVYKCT